MVEYSKKIVSTGKWTNVSCLNMVEYSKKMNIANMAEMCSTDKWTNVSCLNMVEYSKKCFYW